MSNTFPNRAPNVVIDNPRIRKIIRTVLDSLGAVVWIVSAIDVSAPAFDISDITGPAIAGYAAARIVFGFAVDSPNTPKTP